MGFCSTSKVSPFSSFVNLSYKFFIPFMSSWIAHFDTFSLPTFASISISCFRCSQVDTFIRMSYPSSMLSPLLLSTWQAFNTFALLDIKLVVLVEPWKEWWDLSWKIYSLRGPGNPHSLTIIAPGLSSRDHYISSQTSSITLRLGNCKDQCAEAKQNLTGLAGQQQKNTEK